MHIIVKSRVKFLKRCLNIEHLINLSNIITELRIFFGLHELIVTVSMWNKLICSLYYTSKMELWKPWEFLNNIYFCVFKWSTECYIWIFMKRYFKDFLKSTPSLNHSSFGLTWVATNKHVYILRNSIKQMFILINVNLFC